MQAEVRIMAPYRSTMPAGTPMEATVAERGQITLPKAVRDALGLTKGTILKVELDGGRIILRKSVDDAVSRARGRFRLDEGFASTDAAIDAVRGGDGEAP
jgi:antitoxin PrlF